MSVSSLYVALYSIQLLFLPTSLLESFFRTRLSPQSTFITVVGVSFPSISVGGVYVLSAEPLSSCSAPTFWKDTSYGSFLHDGEREAFLRSCISKMLSRDWQTRASSCSVALYPLFGSESKECFLQLKRVVKQRKMNMQQWLPVILPYIEKKIVHLSSGHLTPTAWLSRRLFAQHGVKPILTSAQHRTYLEWSRSSLSLSWRLSGVEHSCFMNFLIIFFVIDFQFNSRCGLRT